MKTKKCPYCGRRVSYVSAYASRRKGEYVCTRCGRESRVAIRASVFPVFAFFAIISVAIMTGLVTTKNINNPFGFVLVAIPLLIFLFISPVFVKFEPLKKYKKTMEARKAGIEYSDNLSTAELEVEAAPILTSSLEIDDGFKINSDVFNKIKSERTAARVQPEGNEILSDSRKIEAENEEDKETQYISVIEDVKEEHASTSAPLKKIHSDNSHSTVSRTCHHISDEDSDMKIVSKKTYKTDGNKYSANRKF